MRVSSRTNGSRRSKSPSPRPSPGVPGEGARSSVPDPRDSRYLHGRGEAMANFVQIGSRVVNLDLVCGAERKTRGGPVTVLFSGGESLRWEFNDQHEADLIWLKLVPRRGDLTD